MKNILRHMLTLGANINKLYGEKLALPFFLPIDVSYVALGLFTRSLAMLELQNSPSDHVAVTRLRLRKREFVILTPKIHSCDWCLSINNEHENRHF